MSQFFPSGGQRTGVSASTSFLPMNIQDWFPLGWTGWISLQSKGLLGVFSNTTVQKHQFFSDQCKEIEENHRMGKTSDLFKKIRDTKATFHAKMDTIKNRNGMDLTEAEAMKKRWQEYTEELYKKDLHDPDNCNGVITHLNCRQEEKATTEDEIVECHH